MSDPTVVLNDLKIKLENLKNVLGDLKNTAEIEIKTNELNNSILEIAKLTFVTDKTIINECVNLIDEINNINIDTYGKKYEIDILLKSAVFELSAVNALPDSDPMSVVASPHPIVNTVATNSNVANTHNGNVAATVTHAVAATSVTTPLPLNPGEFSINGNYSDNIINLREFKVFTDTGEETYNITKDSLQPLVNTKKTFKDNLKSNLEFNFSGIKPGSMFSPDKIISGDISEIIKTAEIKSLLQAKQFFGKLSPKLQRDLNDKEKADPTTIKKDGYPEVYIMYLKIKDLPNNF